MDKEDVSTRHKEELELSQKNDLVRKFCVGCKGREMNMREVFVLFLVLTVMLPSISWGGVADGKSILCHCIDCNHSETGWKFENGKVSYVFGMILDDKITLREESWGSYRSDENTIYWSRYGMGRVLDRSTLIITDTSSNPHEKSRCEVFQSLSEFEEEWETIRKRLQSELNLKLKKNKI